MRVYLPEKVIFTEVATVDKSFFYIYIHVQSNEIQEKMY